MNIIKKAIYNIPLVQTIYSILLNRHYKALYEKSPTLAAEEFYSSIHKGKKLDLENPQTLEEKNIWLALNTDTTMWSVLSDKYADDTHLNSLHASLDNTLEYLGKDVRYSIGDNYIVVKASISKDKQLVLLNNIDFQNTNDLHIIINSNTKSSDVIKLAVGDNYTEGELMMHLKNRGYTCQ